VREETFARLWDLWVSGDPSQAAGREIFEAIRNEERPAWAASVLRWCASRYGGDVAKVELVIEIADHESRWSEAHDAFRRVRDQTLRHDRPGRSDGQLVALLYVAEIAAKVTYNASGAPAPFDADSGWWMGRNLRHFVSTVPDADVAAREAWDRLVAPLRHAKPSGGGDE